MRDLKIMLLFFYDSRENQHGEGRTFLVSVNGINFTDVR
jgi:hypothetical protein